MSGARPDTWMPLYIGDYLADTMHLTREHHGAYLLLIFAYWRRGGPLPDDENHLAAIVKATVAEWRRALRAIMAPFFRIENGAWHHKRIDEEIAEAQRLSNRGSAGGKASAERRANKNTNNAPNEISTSGELNLNPSPSPSPSPSPPSEPKGSSGRARKLRSRFPDDWNPDQQDTEFAREQGLSDQQIAEQAQRCRDHHVAKANSFADFHAAWRTWVTRSIEFSRGNHGNGSGAHGRVNGFVELQLEAERRSEERDRGQPVPVVHR